MKVTDLKSQVKNLDRVNVSIDGTYRFSLTLGQVVDLGVKVGRELDEAEMAMLEAESMYGKVYQRTLEYCLVRPRSRREVRDYLFKKTRNTPVRNRKTGVVSMREGVPVSVTERVLVDLEAAKYVDDYRFAEFWVENRFKTKGVSRKRLASELSGKGVSQTTIHEVLEVSDRNERSELDQVIRKKRSRYADDTKMMQYLARQGFRYDDIKDALEGMSSDE